MNTTADNIETEKDAQPLTTNDEDNTARTVAFPDNNGVQEENRSKRLGPEIKRELTQEDRELAAAGYEHLEENKAKKENSDINNVDIQEHRLSFKELGIAHNTSFDTKDPAQSAGLTSEDAKARLAHDGPNILTPPKKKSALRKVR
jgi:sodium/potassium-transporting ATPase subunit alpha